MPAARRPCRFAPVGAGADRKRGTTMRNTAGPIARREFLALGGSSLLLGSAAAQQAKEGGSADPAFTPMQGQEGKDVIWVPTPDRLVTRMLRLAALEASDYVIDLGSGDG